MKFDLQLFKGDTTNTTTYQATPEEQALLAQQLKYQEAFYPNVIRLNSDAGNLLWDSYGDVQEDFNTLTNNALDSISGYQNTIQNLNNGIQNPYYQQAMEESLKSGTTNLVGGLINDMGNRGVINSSITSKGLNDIESNVANAMAQQYQNNISTQSELAQQGIDNATAGITTAAAGQEAAIKPALDLWNASLGLQGSGNSVLSSVAGKMGTTTSKSSSSGGGLGSSLLGLATGAASSNGLWNGIFGRK